MMKQTRNRLIAIFTLAFPFVLFLGFLVFMAEPLPPPTPMPNPNGYDDLVKAGEMVSTNTWDYDKANLEQLRETSAANAAALALARAGLSNECRVPLQFSQTYVEKHLSDLAGLKRLAQALIAEGRLAELENRPGDAIKSCLETVRLGIVSGRGGTLIDALVGMAIEHIGTDGLHQIAGQLDTPSCREAARALETLDAQRQTWNEIMAQEHDWSRRTFTGARYEIARLMEHKSLTAAESSCERKFKLQQSRTRQLILDLAARAYQLDNGHPPASAADLVPDYLKAVPQDPFTGTNLVYSPR